ARRGGARSDAGRARASHPHLGNQRGFDGPLRGLAPGERWRRRRRRAKRQCAAGPGAAWKNARKPWPARTVPTMASARLKPKIACERARMDTEAITIAIWSTASAKRK